MTVTDAFPGLLHAQGDMLSRSGVIAALRPLASPLVLAENQRLLINTDVPGYVFVVSSGTLVAQAEMAGKRRVLPGILYTGDVFETASAPPLKDLALAAALPSEVLRLSANSIAKLTSGMPSAFSALHERLSAQFARLTMHVNALGALSSEERLAALLIEFAIRLGTPAAGGIVIDMPLSRADMADYLSLNPDTLSRLMSRLRTKAVLAHTGRSHLVVRNWNGLLAECSLSRELLALHGTA